MYVSLNFLEKQYSLTIFSHDIKAYKSLYLTIMFFGKLYIGSQWITFDYLVTLQKPDGHILQPRDR